MEITTLDAQVAWDLVSKICTLVGPGLPASPQERQRAAIIKSELEAHLGAENVIEEEFLFAPDAFLASLPISAVLLILSALSNFSLGWLVGVSPLVHSLFALALTILALTLIYLEFIIGVELVDPLFKQKRSTNVVGRLRKPGSSNIEHLLVISGHHDSALENTWLHYIPSGFMIFSIIWLVGYIVLLVMSFIQLIGVIAGSMAIIQIGTIRWYLLIFPILPSVIYGLFFNMGRKNGGTVPGAVDNLSACALVVALSRFLANSPVNIPDNTEIRFISFGGEEAAVRGSRRYVQRHIDVLKQLDTRVLNYEMVAHPEIKILATDVNGTVRYSPEMVQSVVDAAQRAGVPHKVLAFFLAGPVAMGHLSARQG